MTDDDKLLILALAAAPPPAVAPEAAKPAAPVFGLYLAEVRVQDFRALRDVMVRLERGTTVLIGENNSGKTSFLEALAVALGDRRPRIQDLYQTPTVKAPLFQIDLRFEPGAGEEFHDSVRDIVGDAIRLEPDKPEYFTLRVEGSVSDDGLDITLARAYLKGWAPNRAGAAALEVLKAPLVRREALGLLRFDMLDARRDIVEQLRNRRTHWGRTTSNIDVAPALKATIEGSLRDLGDQVTNNSSVLKQVKSDLLDLSEALSHGQMGIDIEALPRSLDDLIRAMEIVITAPDSSPFAVETQGMGTRSLAALLVFRSYVNVVRPRQHAERILSLSAFEEPEAHLHPQSQRSVFRLLADIAGQRVISTHSTHVASVADVTAFRLFRRNGSQAVVSQVTADQASAWGDAELLRRFVQVQNPEVIYARAVGIVEGQTEAAAFPVFARAWWPPRGADGVGVSIVYTEGAGGSKHIIPFLDALQIPWIVFCDGDDAATKGLAGTSGSLGRPLDHTSPEVVQLPKGDAFESYLIREGFRAQIEAAATAHSDGPLADYASRLHGQGKRKPKGATRDYKSPGWEDRAALDFMEGNKGTVGGLVAEEIIAVVDAEGRPVVPSLVREFFVRLDKKLGRVK
jgi:putative ATP-dependent endonuclease of OLD family